jgi:hypothetical protein
MRIEPNVRTVIALRSLLSPVNCMWSVLPACCTTLTRLGFAAMSQSVVHRFTVSTDGLACLYGVPIREILFHCRVCGVPVLPPLTLNGLRPHSLGNRDAVDHYMDFPRSAIVLTPWRNSVLRNAPLQCSPRGGVLPSESNSPRKGSGVQATHILKLRNCNPRTGKTLL